MIEVPMLLVRRYNNRKNINQYAMFRSTPVVCGFDSTTEVSGRKDDERDSYLYILAMAAVIAIAQRVWLTIWQVENLYIHGKPFSLHAIFIDPYIHWDSGWYIGIARHGYINLKQTAFWPFYPLLIRVVHVITGLDWTVCGVLISFVSFLCFLYFLGRIVECEFDRTIAVICMTLVALFPTSYYFDVAYTESLFMALCTAAVWHAMTDRIWSAGLIAGLAALTRNTGLLIDIILFFEYLRYRNLGLRMWRLAWWRQLDVRCLSLGIPVLFVFTYLVFLKYRTGDFAAFVTAERRYWHRRYMPVWDTFMHTLSNIEHTHARWIREYYGLELGMAALAVAMVVVALPFIRRSMRHVGWCLYIATLLWLTTTQPATHDYLLSFPRFILMLFPGFIYLALLVRKMRISPVVFIVCALGLVHYGKLFFTGVWIA